MSVLDGCIERPFRFGEEQEIAPSVDVFNLFNTGTELNFSSGPGYRYKWATAVLETRTVRVAAKYCF